MSHNQDFLQNDFERVFQDERLKTDVIYQGQSFWKDVWHRFIQNKGALFGFIMIVFLLLMAIFAPMLSSHGYDSVMMDHVNLPPRIPGLEKLGIFDGTHNGVNVYEQRGLEVVYYFFGTDTLGRDIWTRVWIGTRVSLYIAALAVLIDMVFGMTYGMISGYLGGRVDIYMQRFIEILSGIPSLVIVTLLVIVMKPGILSITIALLITGWIGMSRVVRSQVLKLKELDYILASRTLGVKTVGIIKQDILPNIFGQVIIMSMFSIPNAIFYESFLAFIGLGLQPPMASLGVLISDGFKSLLAYPHMLLFPVVVLAILMLSFNLLADGLRDAFDPKMKEM